MCNACGNICCGSDEFGRCGCDGCDEPDCWTNDHDDADDFNAGDEYHFSHACARQSVAGFVCQEVTGPRA